MMKFHKSSSVSFLCLCALLVTCTAAAKNATGDDRLTKAVKETALTKLRLLHVLAINRFYVPNYDEESMQNLTDKSSNSSIYENGKNVSYTKKVFELPKNLSYEHFLENALLIPNPVKEQLYEIGVQLRQQYSNFLNDIYMDETMKAHTNEFPVSQMAGELVNAGLYPPVREQIWNADLMWQPIPFEYRMKNEDIFMIGTTCPRFKRETEAVLNLHAKGKSKLMEFLHAQNITVKSPIDISLLYLTLTNVMDLNQASVPDWVPSKLGELKNASLDGYRLLSKTTLQQQLNGGAFLKRIVDDSRKFINGSLPGRQITAYSGDERLFYGVMHILGLPAFELPNSGSALVFELVSRGERYFMKVLFYLGPDSEGNIWLPLDLQMGNSTILTPLDEFEKNIEYALPSGDPKKLCSGASSLISNFFLIGGLLALLSRVINCTSE
ncbi:hypothetical protein TKK_0002174 [Trichogramma kaykai]